MKIQSLAVLFIISLVYSCSNKDNDTSTDYLADIGDTRFNSSIDNPDFKFCDSSNVLHKRAYVKYEGGYKKFESDLINQHEIKPSFNTFTGYFIVRFAVNCNDEMGRLRWEIVNSDFKETTCPKALENQIITNIKELHHWHHPIYRGNDYDGYTFIIVKIENGNIISS